MSGEVVVRIANRRRLVGGMGKKGVIDSHDGDDG